MQSRIFRRMLPQRRMSWFCWAEIWIRWSRHVAPWNGVTLNTVLTSTASRIRWRGWRTDTWWSIVSCRRGGSWWQLRITGTFWRIRSALQCSPLISHEKCSFVLLIRAALIKEANNKNQDFQNALQSLDFFLVNLPNNKVKPNDDAAQIAAKKYSQEVCRKCFIPIFFVELFLLFTHSHIHTNFCVRRPH